MMVYTRRDAINRVSTNAPINYHNTQMDKFKNKYRIPSARLQTWDYGTNAPYFVTICTAHREHYFGEIVETRFIASELGELAKKYWYEIPKHFPFAELGEFVVMPNHVHGIVIINKSDDERNDERNVETRLIASLPPMRLIASLPPMRLIASLPPTPQSPSKSGGITGNKNPMLNENLSRIIRWYKGRCSFEMRKIHADFEWQSRFHDHIIRNDKSYQTISEYIINNPEKWADDKFYNE